MQGQVAGSGTEALKGSNGYRGRNRLVITMCAAVGAAACLLFARGSGFMESAAMVSAGFGLGSAGALLQPVSGAVEEAAMPGAAAEEDARQGNGPAQKSYDLKAVPADILALMEEAGAEFAGQQRDGDILAKTYTAKEATHSFGRGLTVRNTTQTQQDRDLSKDLAAPLELRIEKSKPAVLIYHTHTTEGFEILDRPWYARDWVSRTENGAKSIVRVGEAIAETLGRAGFLVIHEKQIFDRQYTGAYDKSRAAILRILQDNPSIQVTLDVHRDAIHGEKGVRIKPVASIDGKTAAQVMIITGVNEGNIKDFPLWERNLAFAAKLQAAGEARAPGLMRPLFFCARRYNMHVTPFSLLLEMGSDANTLEEVIYSGRLMGAALADLLEAYAVS